MKTTVLFLLFFCISLGCFAQHNFKLKEHPRIDFESGRLAMDSTYFSFKDLKTNPDFQKFYAQPKKSTNESGVLYYENKMPIARLPLNYWKMPVAVPDSTIKYAIREKRIELINRLGKE